MSERRSSGRARFSISPFSFASSCPRTKRSQIPGEKERSANGPLFCKHIHVKIRIDNTRVVVVIRSFGSRWWRTRTKSLSTMRKRQGLACLKVDFSRDYITRILSFARDMHQLFRASKCTTDHFCHLEQIQVNQSNEWPSSSIFLSSLPCLNNSHQRCSCAYPQSIAGARLSSSEEKKKLISFFYWFATYMCLAIFLSLPSEWKSKYRHRLSSN